MFCSVKEKGMEALFSGVSRCWGDGVSFYAKGLDEVSLLRARR